MEEKQKSLFQKISKTTYNDPPTYPHTHPQVTLTGLSPYIINVIMLLNRKWGGGRIKNFFNRLGDKLSLKLVKLHHLSQYSVPVLNII